MKDEVVFAVLADLMLLFHTLIVAFIVFSLVLVLLGARLGWHWVRNPWFRYAHLLAIGIVVLQSWLGVVCPLTTWEMALREAAGQATYSGAFIAHWLGTILYYEAPAWMFVAIYSVFGSLVVLAWWFVRPRKFRQSNT